MQKQITFCLFRQLLTFALVVNFYCLANSSDWPQAKEKQTYEISSLDSIMDLMPYVSMYVDSPPFQQAEEVLDSTFSPYTLQHFKEDSRSEANKRYWIKFEVKNQDTINTLSAFIHCGSFDRVLSYTVKNNDPVEHQKAGVLYKSRIDQDRYPSLLSLDLKPKEQREFLIHISAGPNLFRGSNEIEARIVPPKFISQIETTTINNSLFKGLLFAGFLFMIGVLVLVSFFSSFYYKDARTITFLFLCIASLMYYLRDIETYFTQKIFWANWDEIVQKTEVLFRGFTGIGLLLFILFSFDLGKWRKTILKTTTLIICFTLFVGIWHFIKVDPYKSFSNLEFHLYLADILLSVIHGCFVLIILWRSGERYSKLHVVATLTCIIINYGGLFLNKSFPILSEGFFSTNLMALYGMSIFLCSLAMIMLHDVYGLKRHLIKESIRAENLEELNKTRNRLFTNITHELRTPLTIITGLSRKLTDNERSKKMIINNGQHLLHLTNQMLDLSKLESGAISVDNQNLELISFLRVLVDSYKSLANEKVISLNFYCELKQLSIKCDKEKIRQVISNLLTNAIKYTPEFGSVMVVCNQVNETIEISVEDNGMGIEQEKIDQIFNRFYKINEKTAASSGIGLSIVKELVRLIDGQIQVESVLHKGSVFTLTLPLVLSDQHETIITNDKKYYESAIEEIGINDSSTHDDVLYNILVIEDNQDIRYYIDLVLNDKYNMNLVARGAQGLKVAIEQTPDIIITDVMMPEMDGIEVCSKLKSNIRTSHIPVIMLTAKADQRSKLEGLGVGADVYLTKPFDEQELLVTIENLLSARKKYQQHYSSKKTLADMGNNESDFIKKIENIIEQNLSNENFTMSHLCELVHLERSQLYRKVKALTGTTPAKMIKQRRLDKAYKLLKSQKGPISEITYQCGFKDVSYFSKQFKDAYGKSPSQLLAAK